MFDLSTPLRALAVGLAGVGLAWLWFSDAVVLALVLALTTAVAGTALDRIGRALLPNRPNLAVRFLEWWALTPAAIAALASAIVVVVTLALTVPEDVQIDPGTKQLIATLSTGLTAFIAASFISWASDEKDSKLADHVREIFQEKYKRKSDVEPPLPGIHYFPAESAGERWVYSDEFKGIEGWGRAARLKRAAGVADELRKSDRG